MMKQLLRAPAALAAFVAAASATLVWIGAVIWAAFWLARLALG